MKAPLVASPFETRAAGALLRVRVCYPASLAMAVFLPRPACGERSDCIARCNPGEGDSPRVPMPKQPPCPPKPWRRRITPTLQEQASLVSTPQAGRGSLTSVLASLRLAVLVETGDVRPEVVRLFLVLDAGECHLG